MEVNMRRAREEPTAGALIFGHIHRRIPAEEVFRRWLSTGSLVKTAKFFAENKFYRSKQTLYYHALQFLVYHPEEAWKIVLEMKPDSVREEFERGVMIYATRIFQTAGAFIMWTKRHPWTEKYSKQYSEYYGINLG